MSIRDYLRRIPGIFGIYRLLRQPHQEFARIRAFRAFARQLPDVHHCAPAATNAKRLLVVSLLGDWVEAVKQEALFVLAGILQGYEPVVLTNEGAWANTYYRRLGVQRLIYHSEYIARARQRVDSSDVERFLGQICSFQDLMDCRYRGVNVGQYICSTLVRQRHTGSIDVINPAIRNDIAKYLQQTMINTQTAEMILDNVQPTMTLFLERGYTPYGEFFDLSIAREINTIQWCGAHKDNAFILRRYHAGNTDQCPASLSKQSWQWIRSLPNNSRFGKEIRNELSSQYASGSWYSEVGTQFQAKIKTREEVLRTLNVDSDKKIAVIFPHLFWDATFFWGEDLFTDYQEWFVETVKAACANPNLNWVIKVHPANIVKFKRDKHRGEYSEVKAIREQVGILPSHIRVLEPNTPIATYSLLGCIDYCLTVRGTVGIEAALFGVPTFTAGTGRYDHLGFTIDSEDRNDYLEKIMRIHTYPRLTNEQIALAERFAYGLFLMRPFIPTSITSFYGRDEKATLNVQYNFRNRQDVFTASDLKEVGQWMAHSGDEDYLDRSKIP